MSTIDEAKVHIATWLNLQQANRVLDGAMDQRLRAAADISMAEYEALFRLSHTGGKPMHMSQIATLLLASPSGATRIADRLVRAGLITRHTPRENRRVVEINLTPKGRQVLERADRAFRQALRETFTANLSAREMETLRALMRKVLEGNDAWDEARCSPGIATLR